MPLAAHEQHCSGLSTSVHLQRPWQHGSQSALNNLGHYDGVLDDGVLGTPVSLRLSPLDISVTRRSVRDHSLEMVEPALPALLPRAPRDVQRDLGPPPICSVLLHQPLQQLVLIVAPALDHTLRLLGEHCEQSNI